MNSQITHSVSSIERQEAQHTGFINQSARAAPGATVVPPAPGKPSGLRLPSPKIGFFDGVSCTFFIIFHVVRIQSLLVLLLWRSL